MVHVKDEVGLGLFFRNSQASERNISVKTEDSVVPKILKIILDNFRIRLLQNQAQGEAQDPQPVAANGYASLNRRFLPVKTEFSHHRQAHNLIIGVFNPTIKGANKTQMT